MKPIIKSSMLILFVIALAGTVSAQHSPLDLAGGKAGTWVNGRVQPGGSPDMGHSIWNNSAISSWWAYPEQGYLNLDWGELPDSNTGLPVHVVDGFSFSYGTNNMDQAGEDIIVYFFDNCVGWGDIGYMEGSFLFPGLPNGCYLPTLPPGMGWSWTITSDLEGTGYEFLLGGSSDPLLYRKIGLGLSFLSLPTMGSTGPALGLRPNQGGNGDTGTENVFDIYYPGGQYNGTYWFGSTAWASWPAEIFAVEGSRGSLTTYAFPQLPGNDNILTASTGTRWPSNGGLVTFYSTRMPPFDTEPCKLYASLQSSNSYYAPYDLTRVIGNFIGGTPIAMNPPWGNATWCNLTVSIPAMPPGFTAYFQAVLGDPSTQMDATQGLKAEW